MTEKEQQEIARAAIRMNSESVLRIVEEYAAGNLGSADFDGLIQDLVKMEKSWPSGPRGAA